MELKYCPGCMHSVVQEDVCPACGLKLDSYISSPHHLPPKTVLMDRYLVGGVLGEGGFGITYIGVDLRLEIRVAIKEFFPRDWVSRHAASSLSPIHHLSVPEEIYEKGKEKFLREARTMARMAKQPAIVGVRDFFEENNTVYIVMEYVKGTTFKELVAQKGGRIPAGELFAMLEPVFSALGKMHAQGLIHRDISPDNLMLEDGSGLARLIDFGCAWEAEDDSHTLTVVLKHGYAPIEQYQYNGQGAWTDVYALSATIYFCLTGRRPDRAVERVLGDQLIPPRQLGAELNERQERTILRGMEVVPRRRIRTMEKLYAGIYQTEEEAGRAAEQEQKTEVRSEEETGDKTDLCPAAKSEEKTGDKTDLRDAADIQPDRKKNGKNRSGGLSARVWILLGAVAAAAAVLALALALKANIKRAGGETGGLSAGAVQHAVTALQGETATAMNEKELHSLMDDPAVKEIRLGDSFADTRLTQPLTVTKRVVFPASLHLTVNNVWILSGPEAEAAVEGKLQFSDDSSFLLTENGGRITVSKYGELSLPSRPNRTLFADPDTDLAVEEGGTLNEDRGVSLPAEEAQFAEAVTVNTQEELLQAAESQDTPIVIASDLKLTDTVRLSVPVRVEKGVSVTASGEACGFLFTGEGKLYNYGELGSQMVRVAEDASGVYLFNYGNMEIPVCASSGLAVLFNRGDMTYSGSGRLRAETEDGNFYNFGSVTIGSPGKESRTAFLMQCDHLENYGRFTVEQDGEVFFSGGESDNAGTLDIRGTLHVENRMEGDGDIEVSSGGELNLAGCLKGEMKIRREEGAAFTGKGAVILTGDGSIDFEEQEDGPAIRRVAEQNFGDVVYASSDQHFLETLETVSVGTVRINREIRVDRDISTDKSLILENGGSLTFADGTTFELEHANLSVDPGADLTGDRVYFENVTADIRGGFHLYDADSCLEIRGGEENTVFLQDSETDLRGGILLISEDTVAVIDAVTDDMEHPMDVIVSERARFFSSLESSGGKLYISSGGVFFGDALRLSDSTADIEQGTLQAVRSLEMDETSQMTLGVGGRAEVCRARVRLSNMVNRGTVLLDDCEAGLGGNMANSGTVILTDRFSSGMRLSGWMKNDGDLYIRGELEVSGKVDNQGKICAADKKDVRLTESGRLNGDSKILDWKRDL